jgi:hypothetical protein
MTSENIQVSARATLMPTTLLRAMLIALLPLSTRLCCSASHRSELLVSRVKSSSCPAVWIGPIGRLLQKLADNYRMAIRRGVSCVPDRPGLGINLDATDAGLLCLHTCRLVRSWATLSAFCSREVGSADWLRQTFAAGRAAHAASRPHRQLSTYWQLAAF